MKKKIDFELGIHEKQMLEERQVPSLGIGFAKELIAQGYYSLDLLRRGRII